MTDLWDRFSASDLRAVVKQFGLACTDKRRIATLREALVSANLPSETLETFIVGRKINPLFDLFRLTPALF